MKESDKGFMGRPRAVELRQIVTTLLLVVVQLIFAPVVNAQVFEPLNQFSPRFNESNSIGTAAIDDDRFYCFWPEWTVSDPSVTCVELKTGKLIWSKPAFLALPATFVTDEGWLIYETTDGQQISPNRTDGLRVLHVVNGATGQEFLVPLDMDRTGEVDRPCLQKDRVVTPQGLVLSCVDGSKVGDLGQGEHQVRVADGRFYVVTQSFNEARMQRDKRFLRSYEPSTMEMVREYELPSSMPWQFVAARGDLVIGRIEADNNEVQLVCLDLLQNSERWKVGFPKSIQPAPAVWRDDTHLVMSSGSSGTIRPIIVDIQSGSVAPDLDWHDPRLLLAWHGESGHYPDLVAANSKLIIGRWRFQQLICVDSETGKLIWNQPSTDYLITRFFAQRSRLGSFVVAESERGFDIVSVQTGERRPILPTDVGLKWIDKRTRFQNSNRTEDAAKLPLRKENSESLMDWGLLLAPLIPLVIWLAWSLIQRRNPFTETEEATQ